MTYSEYDFGSWIEGGSTIGRTVAIVGGASTFDVETANRAEVVVRINNHWMDQNGGRMDVVYSALAEEPTPEMFSFMKERACAGLPVWFFGDSKGGHRNNVVINDIRATGAIYGEFTTIRSRLRPDALHYEPRWCFLQSIMNRYQVKPFTGIVAMLHALHFDVRSVFMTGFTFYAEEDHIPKWRHSHDNEKNRQIVLDTLQHDVRLTVDAAMERALMLPVVDR